MLIDIKKSLSGQKIKGVIQVGAHYGQELQDYIDMGADYIVLFEPCEAAFNELEKRINRSDVTIVPYKLGCADFNGLVVMKTSPQNQGQSNSILEPAKHTEYYKDIRFTTTETIEVVRLDDAEFDRSRVNMLVMDVQGAEGLVLKGAEETLKHIEVIYTEVNTEELYKDCILLHQLDDLLTDFKRVEIRLTRQGWGDAIYKRVKW